MNGISRLLAMAVAMAMAVAVPVCGFVAESASQPPVRQPEEALVVTAAPVYAPLAALREASDFRTITSTIMTATATSPT